MNTPTPGQMVLFTDEKRTVWPAIVLRQHENTSQLDLRVLRIFGDETDLGVPFSATLKIGHYSPTIDDAMEFHAAVKTVQRR